MLFADLSGYTALAESLDPEEVYSFLRPTMLELQRVVESFGGSVPQIQGDGFMAVFGVPTAHEDDAERAVRAALAVRDHVRALNEGRAGLSFPQVHAGVNSGEVMVGPSEEASGYTVMGDTVNTASRMADLATAGHVLVDASTRTLTASSIRYGPRRMRKAKGKAEPIATFEALGPLARDPASARGRRVRGSGGVLRAVRARAGRNRGGRVLACGGPHGRAGHRKEPARQRARKLPCTRSVPPGPMRPVR